MSGEQSALELWREKLHEFQKQEAIASDPGIKFQLKKHIEECQQKIKEIESDQANNTTTVIQPPSHFPENRSQSPSVPRKFQGFLWIGALLLLSLLPPIQDLLLEPRLLIQAFYRHLTHQVPSQVESPLLLVKIDNKSLVHDQIKQRHPIDYSYLGKLVKQASGFNAKVIGIDYILDQTKKQTHNTKKLASAITQAEGIKFVFATIDSENPYLGSISEEIVKLDSNWYQQGNINLYQWYMEIPDRNNDLISSPFAYQLALNHSCYQDQSINNSGFERKKPSNSCLIVSSSNQLSRFLCCSLCAGYGHLAIGKTH